MERTRIYYRSLGYTKDYVWAHHEDAPFARPDKPVRAMKIALITTAGPGDRSHRDERNRRHVWSGQIDNPPATFNTDTDDRESYLPIDATRHQEADLPELIEPEEPGLL